MPNRKSAQKSHQQLLYPRKTHSHCNLEKFNVLVANWPAGQQANDVCSLQQQQSRERLAFNIHELIKLEKAFL